MTGILEEFTIFILAILSGMIVRMVYGCISCFRKIVKHNRIVMEIEDFFFWMGTALYIFVQIYHTSDGSIRWYSVLGIVAGAVFSSCLLKKVEKCGKKMYGKKEKNSVETIDK